MTNDNCFKRRLYWFYGEELNNVKLIVIVAMKLSFASQWPKNLKSKQGLWLKISILLLEESILNPGCLQQNTKNAKWGEDVCLKWTLGNQEYCI